MEQFDSYFFVASPYTHPDPAVPHMRYVDALVFSAGCLKAGIPVFSPIVYTHPLALQHDLPDTYPFWRTLSRNMIKPSHGLIIYMLDGWRTSTGLRDEEAYAAELDKLIVYTSKVPDPEMLLERLSVR